MRNIVSAIIIILMTGFGVHAQSSDYKTGLLFKKLFLDYQSQNDGNLFSFKDYTSGYEIGIHREFSNKLGLTIPIRYGLAHSHIDSISVITKKLVSLDAQLNYHFTDFGTMFRPYILAGVGGVYEKEGDFNVQFPLGLGLNIRVASNAYVQLQTEFRISNLEKRNNLQHGIGFVYMLGKTDKPEITLPEIIEPELEEVFVDSDGDGVPDHLDECPDMPGLKEFKGCPDTDGDGVPDHLDACPDVAGLKIYDGCPDTDGDGIPDHLDDCPDVPGTVANRGCPEDTKELDSDGDGIPDHLDDCPYDKGPKETNGCPDRDGDGIPDHLDKCPDKPGLKIYEGCPDTDGDGIPDHLDDCPNTPGTVANRGCPEIDKEDKKTLDIAMQAVQFQVGSSVLKTESYVVLDQITDIMQRYPDFNMHISGHTDNTGNSVSNQTLSERRAKACYDYLLSKGISASRMTSTGYGESRPISTNATDKGRALNRRVEFNLIPRGR